MAKSMKNPNGFGSCYKAKGKREKPWIARKTIGWEIKEDGTVKQIKKTIGYFKTKAEGLKALANYSYNKHEDMTIEQLYNEWQGVHSRNLKESSKKGLESKYNVHISKLAKEKISDLRLSDYQNFYDNLGVATQTSKHIMAVLNMMLNYAVKHDYILKNYASFVDKKKNKSVIERKAFTSEEIERLWEFPNGAYTRSILFMIFTGLRVSEMRNLKWEDIEFKERYFTVTESKTDAGRNRIVPLTSKMIELLENKERTSTYVFANKKGVKIAYATYRRRFVKLMNELNMNHTIHDCRHTFATMMSNADANQISISKIIGHKNYSTTANIYTSKDKEELLKAIDRLN